MFNNKANLGELIQQAQQMQDKMEKEITKIEVIGESGAGLVQVVINGAYNCCDIKIDSSLFKENKEIIEDLILSAFNNASYKLRKIQKEKMACISNNIQTPLGI